MCYLNPHIFPPTGNEIDLILMSTFTICRCFLTICIFQEQLPLWKFILKKIPLRVVSSVYLKAIIISSWKSTNWTWCLVEEWEFLVSNWENFSLASIRGLCTLHWKILNQANPGSLDHSRGRLVRIMIAHDHSGFCKSAAGLG